MFLGEEKQFEDFVVFTARHKKTTKNFTSDHFLLHNLSNTIFLYSFPSSIPLSHAVSFILIDIALLYPSLFQSICLYPSHTDIYISTILCIQYICGVCCPAKTKGGRNWAHMICNFWMVGNPQKPQRKKSTLFQKIIWDDGEAVNNCFSSRILMFFCVFLILFSVKGTGT